MISSPEPDTYGPYARASLLADYMELLALKGQSVRRATVADFLADSGSEWNLELIQPLTNGLPDEQLNDLSERLALADDRASIAFGSWRSDVIFWRRFIPSRSRMMRSHLTQTWITKPTLMWHVLALTIAHAFHVASPSRRRFYSSRR